MEIKDRPVCVCGEKMTLVEYEGYYDEFKYWACYECDLDDKIQDMNPDETQRGAYA